MFRECHSLTALAPDVKAMDLTAEAAFFTRGSFFLMSVDGAPGSRFG